MGEYLYVLKAIHLKSPSLQSNFSRRYMSVICEMACRGHISCVIGAVSYNSWFITKKGLSFYEENLVVKNENN